MADFIVLKKVGSQFRTPVLLKPDLLVSELIDLRNQNHMTYFKVSNLMEYPEYLLDVLFLDDEYRHISYIPSKLADTEKAKRYIRFAKNEYFGSINHVGNSGSFDNDYYFKVERFARDVEAFDCSFPDQYILESTKIAILNKLKSLHNTLLSESFAQPEMSKSVSALVDKRISRAKDLIEPHLSVIHL